MFKNLNAGAIGIRGASLEETIRLASDTGFGGVDFDIREAAVLADAYGLDHVIALFEDQGVRPGQWGLPVDWQDEARWKKGITELPKLAAVGKALGCPRTSTWMLPASDERPFEENFEWHVARFRPITEVLEAFDCRLGIEFIGPKTLREGKRYPFIYTLEGLMELAEAIGMDNVGVLLDAWHLYTSGGTVDDLDQITAHDVVTVHVNDAPAGVPRDEQIDSVRCLPMETGVIDLPAFIRKLYELGYEGPVTPEPFSKSTNELAAHDPRKAAKLVAAQMDKLWEAAGLN
ncbi:MAG: sugar phosphate isomerase/epimerase family protein [Anaerolineae bacterium]